MNLPGALLLLSCFGLTAAAHAQSVDTTLSSLNSGGSVLAIAHDGDTIYLGGSFAYIGPVSGGGVPIDIRSVKPIPGHPRVTGRVYAVLADGEGGWFIGGSFTHVGGLPRANLAHLLAGGSVAEWSPDADGEIRAMVRVGQTLYVGGEFHRVSGAPRARLAALDLESAAALPWTCDVDQRVTALVVRGSTLYVGGWFANVAGQPRAGVAALDLASGAPTPWQVTVDDRVASLALRDTTLYIGGYFWTVNGESRRCVAAVGAESAIVHSWDARLERTPISTLDGGPHVNAFLLDGPTLFVAGTYSKIGGQDRRGLAQLDASTALATEWDPRPRPDRLGPEFYALERSGDTLFVAGIFDSLGGESGPDGGRLAALSASTGARIPFEAGTNGFVFALAVQGGALYLGGEYTSMGNWVLRRRLAAIDATTGRVTDWDPQPNNPVRSLLVHDGKVYVGGHFSRVGGQPRTGIAALDPQTGLATPWNPGASAAVWSMAPLGNTIIAAGIFSAIGGQARRGIAAIDTSTGLATSWDPHGGGDVYSVAVTDSVIYVGGDFLTMGGQPRKSLAALDPITGMATPWNPGVDGSIDAIAVLDETIFVGGWFHQLGGLPREFLAGIDRFGVATSWAPQAYGPTMSTRVRALAASDSTVFVAGDFSGLSGESRAHFAALDARTAVVRPEYPEVDGPLWALATSDGNVYLGGLFGRVGSWPASGFAGILPPAAPPPPPPSLAPYVRCVPNPVLGTSLIHYTLPAGQTVRLTVFDLQGRPVARVLSDQWQAAGPQQVPLVTAGWQPGCYLYRLETRERDYTGKLVVLR